MNDIIVESVDVPMKRPLVTGGGTVDSAPLVLIRLKAGDIKGASYVFCRRAGVFLEGIGPIGATEIWYYNQSLQAVAYPDLSSWTVEVRRDRRTWLQRKPCEERLRPLSAEYRYVEVRAAQALRRAGRP